MKVKLAPFPGTSAENSYLSTAWSRDRAFEDLLLVCGSEGGKISAWRVTVKGSDTDSLSGQTLANLSVGTEEEDVGAVCFENGCTNRCYVACGAKLVLLDFGAATGNGTPRITGEWTFNDDDINCLALSEDNQFLAAADDTGEIKLIHLKPQVKVHRTLRKHTTICSSVLFRPRRPTSILSSGLDSVIVVWEDFSRCRVGQVVKMADVVKVAAANKREMEGDAEPEPPSSYMINPPLVHCVAASPNGNWLVAGVEDSSIQLFDTSKKTVIYVTSSPSKIHTKGVGQLSFISDDKFISGGNDGLIAVWQITQTAITTTTTDSTEATSAASEGNVKRGNSGKRQKSAKNKTSQKTQQPQSKVTIQTVVQCTTRINHEQPINWISILKVGSGQVETGEASRDPGGDNGSTTAVVSATAEESDASENKSDANLPLTVILAVADSSSDIVLYSVTV